MTKKKSNKDKKQPWSIPLRAREELYNGINPSAGFGIGSFLSQGLGYLGGFRTGKGMSEDEARWAAYLGLPYDKEYAPDTKIRFEHDKDYPDRQYQGVSKRAKNEIREEVIPEAKRIKDEYGKEWIQVLDERGIFGNDSTIYHPRETYTGDLGKFGIREVGNSGIYEIGDKYDFPSWVPVPDRNKGTELMIRDTIWSDRANPKLYNKEIIKRKKKFYDGGLKVDMPNFKGTQLTSNISTKTPLSYSQSFKVGAANAWNNVKTGQANGALNTAATAVGGLVNAAFGSNINEEFVNQVEAQARQQSNYVSGATDNTSLMSDWEALAFLEDVKKSDVGSEGWFSNKATNETARLNTLTDEANMRALASISNTAENIDEQNDLLLQANYSAYGGKLNKFDNGGFANFINSDSFNGIGDSLMGFSYTTGGEDQYIQNSLGRNHGSGYYGVASKAGMATYDIINGIRNLTKSKRTPIENKIGLYANGGNINKYAGIVESGAKLIGNAVNEANNMVDIKPIQKQVRQFGNTNFGGTNDDLVNQWKNTSFLSPNVTTRDIRNKSYFDDFMTSVPASFEGFNAGSSFGPIGAAAGAIIGGASSLVGSFIGRNKAEKRAKRLNASITRSNERVRNNFNLAVENNNKDMLFNMMKNYSAYGGPISGALDYEYYNNITNNDKLGILGNMKFTSLPNSFSNVEMQELKTFADGGKIHIKPSKRGTFTAAAKKRGMGVQEFASKVLANKEDYSSAMVKKANFARNASKWKHADGGNLFTNGVITVGNGGTHEQSPLEGVPMGVDNQGIPNLVEEGEVIFNDYVFSNRLRVPKEVRQKYKLTGVTFADAAKQLQKESEERPNDPISKNGLNAVMTMLQQEQEAIRMKKESNKYAKGGKLGRVYDGTGGDPNWLYKPITQGFIPSKDDILAEMEAMYSSLLGESTLPIASKIEGSTAFKDRLGIKGEEQSSKVAPMKTHPLRYVPLGINFAAVANDLLGGNEPDYSNANMFARAIEGTNRPIRARQIGNYLTYRPFDSNYYINTLNANTTAARRAAVNTSGGNRAAALTGILAADYNYGNQLGALARQAEEYNLAQRQAVEQFNRGTNVTNAEMAMKADLANAEQAMQRARMYGSLAEYRDKILAANRAEKSANLTNFIQGLGNLGTELTDKDKLRWLAELGVLKYDASGKYTGDKKSNVGAKGGRINRKKRGGFTI